MKILLHDFANYAFIRQLAESLADRGHDVTFAFNSTYPGPNRLNSECVSGNGRIQSLPLDPGVQLTDKKPFVQRLKMERSYANVLLRYCESQRFDRIISADTPSLIQSKLSKMAERHKVPFVSWVQDLYGYAALKILKKKIPFVGSLIGNYFIKLDEASIRRSHATVVITDQFIPFMKKLGVRDEALNVVENWAPINRIPVQEKANDWSRRIGLNDSFRFVYTGTLAMKHNPSLLVELAKALHVSTNNFGSSNLQPSAEVVLVSSGEGARYVQEQAERLGLPNLRCLGFQPEKDFPSILGSADVLLAILEEEAGQFSVPSKVLSYFCAARPILASIPSENLAARTIRKAQAGLTVSPGNTEEFINAAIEMRAEQEKRSQWGMAGRAYAETAFDIEQITDKFEAILH